jgi:integrase
MAERKAKITKRLVDSIEAPEVGEVRVWDTDLKGFHLRVRAKPKGEAREPAKVYALRYRIGSVQRTYTIGRHGSPWTPDTAREKAEEALIAAKRGEDPAVEKKKEREALTVGQLIDRYLEDGPAMLPAKRASSWGTDATNLNCHVRYLLGRKMADHIAKADAARAIRDIAEGKTARTEKTEKARGRRVIKGGDGAARRTLETTAAMFKWGVEHELVKANPFASVKLAAAPKRERFLSREEAGRVLDAINQLEASGELSKTFGDAIRLLLLTGARKTEILGLRWAEIDFERKSLVLPPERTKAGGKTGERRVVLSPPALQLLQRRQREAAEAMERARASGDEITPSPFVFPASHGNRHRRGLATPAGKGHAVGLRKPFLKVLKVAEVDEVRVHDARHTFASFLIADGASLFLVGKLLGHASMRTTERYAHLSNDPLADAAAVVGARLIPVVDAANDGPERDVEGGPKAAQPGGR